MCGNFSFGVSKSSLPILEEEGLEDGVLSPEAFSQGCRKETYLPRSNLRLGFLEGLIGALDLDSFVIEEKERAEELI